jgi:hypothetical protein
MRGILCARGNRFSLANTTPLTALACVNSCVLLVGLPACTSSRAPQQYVSNNPPPPCATPSELFSISGTIVYEGDPPDFEDPDRGFEIWVTGFPHWTSTFLAGGRGFDGHVSWSPSGNEVVYASHAAGNSDLYIVHPESAVRTRLTSSPVDEDYPVWLPQGIVYGRNVERWTLLDPESGAATLFEIGEGVDGFSYSPDGSRLVVSKQVSHEPNEYHLYLVHADGSMIRQLTQDFTVEIHPQWAPTGNQIVYSARTGPTRSDWDVYRVDADSGVSVRVTSNPGADWAAGWSPDGAYVLVSSEYDGDWDVYVIRPDGSGRLRITCGLGSQRGPAWTFRNLDDPASSPRGVRPRE